MSDSTHLTVYAQGHPFNSWVLYPLSVPYISLDGGTRQRLRWGKKNAHTFTDITAGDHTLLFELRYKGFKNPISSVTGIVTLQEGENAEYRVRNGWTNQHPFVFTRMS